MILKRMIELLKEYLKMNNIIELTDPVNKYRLDEINKIRDYFDNEIKERKDIIKKLNKYLVSFDYLDKIFITLSASFGTLSIASYASVVGIPPGIKGASLNLVFTLSTGISKWLLNLTKKRKKKHNKINILAKNKLNTIDTLLSSALNDSKISHEEFSNIITEKNIYEILKENIRNTIEPPELPNIAELTSEPNNFLKRSTLQKMERKKKQTYCLICRDYTKSINPKIVRNRQNRYTIQSNCATCGSKKFRFINEQKALGILSNLGIKTPISQVPLLSILF